MLDRNQKQALSHSSPRSESQELARRATVLTKHYPSHAVTDTARTIAKQHREHPSDQTAQALDNLGEDLFTDYFAQLHEQTSWSYNTFLEVIDRTAILELTEGCSYGCDMCYISAPKVKSHIAWPHVSQLVEHLAARQKEIIQEEAVDALVSDVFSDFYKEPETNLDIARTLAKHRRNRFNNFSDKLMSYWRSNSTSWRDPLFRKDFSHVAELISSTFRIVDTEKLLQDVRRDASVSAEFDTLFKDDRTFHDLLTLSVALSTVPFAENSLGHNALERMLSEGTITHDYVRVSAPHPNLMPSFAGNHTTYWSQFQNTIALGDPKVINLFATSTQELRELAQHTYGVHSQSSKQWWIEARLVDYSLREAERNGITEGPELEALLTKLQASLKRIMIIAAPEGKGAQFEGNPFFSAKGSVMCVNGVVLSDNALHYQACTTPGGEDLDKGQTFQDIQKYSSEDIAPFLEYRLLNRSRESVTPNLQDIPFDRLRRPVDWFERRRADLRSQSEYVSVRRKMEERFNRFREYLLE